MNYGYKDVWIDQDECIECGECKPYCPVGAIKHVSVASGDETVPADSRAFVIVMDKCHYCGDCIDKCPVNAIKYEDLYKDPEPEEEEEDEEDEGGGNTELKWNSISLEGVEFSGYDSSDPKGCLRRCQEMISPCTVASSTDSGNKQMTKYDSSGNLITDDCDGGLELIASTLIAGNPIIVGVDYKTGHAGNVDNTTDHWIVIVGRGNDEKGNYFNFYDPATAHEHIGASSDNKLYLQDDDTLKGTFRSNNYTVTMVRKSICS